MKYRPEIDGFRAMAVLSTIFYHAGLESFTGGFVGVDVFFVISGYLITTIMLEDVKNKKFSLIDFYERRVRRIFPALFVITIICIPFAWLLMIPSQLKDFSQSLVGLSLLIPNLLFWYESGYFSTEILEIPLIHTWSLGVEIQFYILFPIIFILSSRLGNNRLILIIFLLMIFSFLLCEFRSRTQPIANYYLLPTRSWEILSGSVVSLFVQRHGVQKNDFLSFSGFLIIVFSIFSFDPNVRYPSVYTLAPVTGTLLVILYAHENTFVARLLSFSVLVKTGLISYSLYLFHQPLFAFARIFLLEDLSFTQVLYLITASFVLAYLTWKFIETPLHKTKIFRTRTIFIGSIAGLFSICVLGVLGHANNGFYQRFSTDEQILLTSASSNPLRRDCHFRNQSSSLSQDYCTYFYDSASVAVVGDSHATELAYALALELEPFGKGIRHHTMSSCTYENSVSTKAQSVCKRWHAIVLASLLKDNAIKTVVLSYKNDSFIHDEMYRKNLTEMVIKLSSNNKKVILVLQMPLPGAHVSKFLQKALKTGSRNEKGLSRSEWDDIYQSHNLLLAQLPPDVIVLDPRNLVCDKFACNVIQDGRALYFDDHHPSVDGALIIAKEILKYHLTD